jgi:hypothetical protein
MARGNGGRHNAMKHGAYAHELILPGESSEQFESLYKGLIEEWRPSGTLEEHTVLSLAQSIWCRNRISRFYYEEALWVQQPEEDELNYVDELASQLGDAKTVEMAAFIISLLPEDYREVMNDELAQARNGDLKNEIPRLSEKLHKFLIMGETAVVQNRSKIKFEKARQLRELTAKKIALDERLDSHIDKALKRLGQLKAFKQLIQTSALKTVDQTRISDKGQSSI